MAKSDGRSSLIYLLSVSLKDKGGAASWSETTSPRKPAKGVDRFYPTDNDCYPLGPFPESLKSEIENHWLLLSYGKKEMPKIFNSIIDRHFSGLQPIDKEVSDTFCNHADGLCEVIRIPKVWSLTSNRQIDEAYFLANVFRSVKTIDLEGSNAMKVVNPKVAIEYTIPMNPKTTKINSDFTEVSGVWRDSSTSFWFCDDAFKTDMESVAPDYYRYDPVTV